jgi:hypothetical protein
VSRRTRDTWVQAVGAARVEETVEQLTQTAKNWMVESRSIDPILEFGSGPCRDVELARQVAVERDKAGWTRRDIRDYLQLYGFRNFSGTVGRWSHDQLVRLLSDVS